MAALSIRPDRDAAGSGPVSLDRGGRRAAGWFVFVSAVGVMAGMVAIDVASLRQWSDMETPTFVGTTLGHLASVIAAFVGGKLVPEDRPEGARTRVTDGAASPYDRAGV